MRVSLLLFLLGLLAAGCSKTNPPLKVYFVGSTRFTTATRTATAADTLATRLYFDDSGTDPAGLTNLRVTVDYRPMVRPFAYPNPLTGFLFSSIGNGTETLVYLDTTYVAPLPVDLLYTTTFGVRTSTGNENWTFTMRDTAGNVVSRGFTIKQRRTDSLVAFNDYTLKLNLPATGRTARRFLDFEDGLALPAHAVGNLGNAPWQSRLSAVLLPDGTLASPDGLKLNPNRWLPANQLPHTRFALTTLKPATFTGIEDTFSIRQPFVPPFTTSIQPGTDQVYAFRTDRPGQPKALFGLLRVVSTTVGLQLELKMAKQPL